MEGTATELLRARQKRIEDAIALRVPDRAPVWLGDCGTMTDMYRRPEKLLAVIDKLTPRIIATAIAAARASGNPGVFMVLHRGAAGARMDGTVHTVWIASLAPAQRSRCSRLVTQ